MTATARQAVRNRPYDRDDPGDALDSSTETLGASTEQFVRAWRAALVFVPSLMIFVLGYFHRWMSDDGLIVIRTVRQLVAGHPPVFNIGERAESSSSTLWQWLLAVATWVTRQDPTEVAVYVGLFLTVAGFAFALLGTRRLHEINGDDSTPVFRRHRLLLPGGILVLLVLPPVWDFATSGLETGLVTFWIGLCWFVLVRSRSGMAPGPSILAAALLGLGPLVRPELGIVAAGFLVALWAILRPEWRLTLAWLLAAAAVPLLYEVFRMGYYGLLVPLPALTKEAGTSELGRGFGYISDFVGPYGLWLPLAGIGILHTSLWSSFRRSHADRVLLTAPLMCGGLSAVYVVKVGGDWMHGRMLLPALFLLCLPALLVPIERLTGYVVAAIAAYAVVSLTPIRPPFEGGPQTHNARREAVSLTYNDPHPITAQDWEPGFPDLAFPIQSASLSKKPTLVFPGPDDMEATPLRPDAGATLVLAYGYLGVAGAAVPLEQRVADQWSLAYPLGAHFAHAIGPIPGHEKHVDDPWLFADYADPSVALPAGVDPKPVAAARHALSCGSLKELQDSVRKPMSWRRFWSNLTGAVGRTELRVPRDPYQAERTFCGSTSP